MATLAAATTMVRLASSSSVPGQCCGEGCVALWDGVRGRSRRREPRHHSADCPVPQEERLSNLSAEPRTPERPRQATSSKPCEPPRKPDRSRQAIEPQAKVGELSETAAELLDEAAGLLVEAASVQMISINQASASKDSDGSEPVESMELLSLAFKLEGEALRESKTSRHQQEPLDAWSNLVAQATEPAASASPPNTGRRHLSWAEDAALVHVYQQVDDESQQNQTESGPLPAQGSRSPVTSSPQPAMRRMSSLRQLSVDGVVDQDADAKPLESLAPETSLKPVADSRPPPAAGRRGGLRRSEKGNGSTDRAAREQAQRKCAFDEVQTMAMMDSSNVSVKPGICCLSLFSCAACFEEAIDNMQ